jgi:hypothetical protein
MERPVFNHEEIEELYNYHWDLHSVNVLPTILALPRQSLIEDLTKVIEDGITNFSEYEKAVKVEETLTWQNIGFVQAAIHILAEIEATEARGIFEKCLYQEEAFNKLYLEEFDTEEFPQCLIRIIGKDYDFYTKVTLDNSLYWINRSAAMSAMSQIVIQEIDEESNVLPYLKSVIEILTERRKGKNDTWNDDNIMLGYIAGALYDMKTKALNDVMKQAFDADVVDESICGDYTDFIALFEAYPDMDNARLYTQILKFYEEWYQLSQKRAAEEEKWEAEREQKAKKAIPKVVIEPQIPDINKAEKEGKIAASGVSEYTDKKVGRNEPCPCGSGKKYKKCHGKN